MGITTNVLLTVLASLTLDFTATLYHVISKRLFLFVLDSSHVGKFEAG
jgi:hypothetical protein